MLLRVLTISGSGLFAYVNLAEWFTVKVQGRVASYPFGGEGPTPYYYQTAELYASVCLLWGLAFLAVLAACAWTGVRCGKKRTLILFAVTLLLLSGHFIHGQMD